MALRPVLLASLLLASPPSVAPAALGNDDDVLDLSGELEELRAELGAPGLLLLAVQDGRPAARGVAGVRAVGGDARLALDDPMHLGSCTKAMTATLIGVLVEEGLLTWDSTLGEVLPELAAEIDPGYAKVTVLQLLRHRAGIAERRRPEIGAFYDAFETLEGAGPASRLAMLRQVLALPPSFPAEGEFDYSNFGYMAVGAMAERVAEKPWEELIVERLFRPLGMGRAGVGSPAGPDAPVGHVREGEAWRALPPGPEGRLHVAIGPAGLTHASLDSWSLFVADQLAGARGDEALLPSASYALIQEPPEGSTYAAGWANAHHAWSWGEGRVLVHNGSDGSWFSLVYAMPEWDLVVLTASNCGEPEGDQATTRARDLALKALGFDD